MAHPNPAHHRFHVVETYHSRPRPVRRVAQLSRAPGSAPYMVIVRRLWSPCMISEGKRADLAQLPKPGGCAMRTLADLIEAAEGLQRLVADARADCAAARRRPEELRRSECVDHAQLLAGLVQLRARLHTTEARR